MILKLLFYPVLNLFFFVFFFPASALTPCTTSWVPQLMTDNRALGFCGLTREGIWIHPSVNLVNFSIKIICIDWKC